MLRIPLIIAQLATTALSKRLQPHQLKVLLTVETSVLLVIIAQVPTPLRLTTIQEQEHLIHADLEPIGPAKVEVSTITLPTDAQSVLQATIASIMDPLATSFAMKDGTAGQVRKCQDLS